MYLAEEIQNKWAPVLDHDALGSIKDQHRRSVTAVMLENTEKALRESAAHGDYQTLTETSSLVPANLMGASSSTQGTGGIDTFDPVLISLVRRAMPNLIAYDICGVQPMTGPTGLIMLTLAHTTTLAQKLSTTKLIPSSHLLLQVLTLSVTSSLEQFQVLQTLHH
jgi:hypothetical protein